MLWTAATPGSGAALSTAAALRRIARSPLVRIACTLAGIALLAAVLALLTDLQGLPVAVAGAALWFLRRP